MCRLQKNRHQPIWSVPTFPLQCRFYCVFRILPYKHSAFVRVVFVWLQERRSHGAGLLRSAERSVGQTVRPRLSPSNEKHWKHYVFSAFSFAFWSGFSLALAAAPALSPVSISTDESAELILRLLCSGRVYPRLSSYRRDPHPSVRRAFGKRKPARRRFSA